jgi:2-C-methyl-D-erythritol 4-phosphate cytidylyltransferase
MKKITLIVAAGTGIRMGSSVPKQFLPVNGLPVLMHTIRIFHFYDPSMEIRLVLQESEIANWEKLCAEHQFDINISVYKGGDTRFQSVKNGLSGIPDQWLVAVHDGVRPLVSRETIRRCFENAEQLGAVIPVTGVKESVRLINGEDSVAADRSLYRLVQTPGVFHSGILKEAYNLEYNESFTDDATVIEAAGYKIFLTEGNEENIKITSPVDLLIAEALLK